MKIKNALLWQDYSPAQALIGTGGIMLIAFGLRYLIHPIIAPYGVFHFFIVGCLSVQYLFGYKFSIPSMLASTILGEYYFVEPYGIFDGLAHVDLVIAFNFLLVTTVAVAFMEKLRRAAYAQELLLKVMKSRHKVSLQRENDRLFYARQSNEVWALLEELILGHDKILIYQYGGEYRIGLVFYKRATQFSLDKQPDEWVEAIRNEDVTVLKARLANDHENGDFKIHLIQHDGREQEVCVTVDHFRFMGKKLSLVRLVSA